MTPGWRLADMFSVGRNNESIMDVRRSKNMSLKSRSALKGPFVSRVPNLVETKSSQPIDSPMM